MNLEELAREAFEEKVDKPGRQPNRRVPSAVPPKPTTSKAYGKACRSSFVRSPIRREKQSEINSTALFPCRSSLLVGPGE